MSRSLVALAVAALLALQAGDTLAQQQGSNSQLQNLQNLTPDQMRQMFGGSGNGSPLEDQNPMPQYTILEPTAPTNPPLAESRLEQIMAARTGVKLAQFGYDQLGVGRPVNLPQVGGIQDDYILGTGDEVSVTLRGQDNTEQRVTVDRDGNVILPRISPIAAAGRRFGDFRADLLAAIHNAYMSTEAYISIGRLRQISVLVAGEVNSPGVRILTGLSSPIDAILVSGGISKSGSLRNVKLIHQGRTTSIDLYAFLTSGIGARRLPLADGDRIVVPPLKNVVAVAGWVRRPGIYEMAPGQTAISVRGLEELAGGLEVRGRYRLAILRVRADGQTQLAAVTSEGNILRDGEVLMILPGADQVVDRATLAGGSALAGSYSISPGSRLSEVLKAPGALGDSPYSIFGIISRRDPRTYLRSLIAFSPIAALSGVEDPPLVSGDIVRVFSMREGRLLSQSVTLFAARKEMDEELTRNPYSTRSASNAMLYSGSGNQTSGGGSSGDQSSIASLTQAYTGSNTSPSPSDQSAQTLTNSGLYSMGNLAATTGGGAAEAQAAANMANQASSPGDQTGQSVIPAVTGDQTLSVPGGGIGALQSRQLSAIATRKSSQQAGAPPPANFEEQTSIPGTVPLNTEVTSAEDLANQLDVDEVVLLNFLSDHEVTLDGAVRGPGSYVVGPGINLHDLVMVAGGTVRWADESGVELITTDVNQQTGDARTVRRSLPLNSATLASYNIRPHDELRFRQVFTQTGLGPVTLEGEVRFPGEYKIVRGERLADLLKRAGGLTEVAYPYGTVYLRRSVAALEEASFRRVADEIENQLMAAMSRTTTQYRLDSGTFTSAQGFIEVLRTQKGLGRISIIADPTVLSLRPEQNALLEPGDVIYIPQRPSTVSVLGEVLEPGSFVYQPHLSAQQYLAKAGGYSAFADDSLTYIILPDGSAEKLDQSWLPFGKEKLPPGSVIVVPRDIAPFQWSDFAISASQIFSQLAVAGASLAVISTNLK